MQDLKVAGNIKLTAKPIVLLRGGHDTVDGKWTGDMMELCPAVGPEVFKELGTLLQRALDV